MAQRKRLPSTPPPGAHVVTADDLAARQKIRESRASEADWKAVFGSEVVRPDGSFGGRVDLRDPKKRALFGELMRPQMRAESERSEQLSARQGPRVPMKGPDGNDYLVAPGRVAHSEARGFREGPSLAGFSGVGESPLGPLLCGEHWGRRGDPCRWCEEKR